MSKVRGPLGSIGASGTIGKSMIHQPWKGIPRVKRYRKPTQPNSYAQLDKRNIMSRAITRWQGLSLELKLLWEVYNKKTGKIRSGYNYFLSEYIHWTCEDYVPSDDPRIPPTPPTPTPPPPPGPIEDELVSWWKLDTLVADVVEDSWGENDGVNHGASLVGGKINNALSFDGTDDYVDVGDIGIMPDKGSIEFWLNSTTGEGHRNPMTTAPVSGDGGANNGIRFEFEYNNLYVVFGTAVNVIGWQIIPSAAFIVDTWFHLVVTWDKTLNKVKGYRDSVKVLEETCTYWADNFADVKFGVGFDDIAYRSYKGMLDEIRYYTKELSQENIDNNYNL